jgi:predicted nucleic acid-binding protein
MEGLTFDTGALIALEQRNARIAKVLAIATAEDLRITVPAVVLAEWWRGPSKIRAQILAAVDVEPADEELAKAAGEALAVVRSATISSTIVDVIVMASAARRGDVVYTSDFADLDRLRQHFPTVRVLRV